MFVALPRGSKLLTDTVCCRRLQLNSGKLLALIPTSLRLSNSKAVVSESRKRSCLSLHSVSFYRNSVQEFSAGSA